MEKQNSKFKIDGFYLVIAGAFIFGILSIVFIFTTAMPKEIKLIKWSDTNSPPYILESLSRIQYPVFRELYSIQIKGLSELNLTPEQAAIVIGQVLDLNVTSKENKSLKTAEEETFILNPNSKRNLKIVINKALVDAQNIKTEDHYDPLSLKKLLKKLEGRLLFTAYKSNASQIYLEVIQLQ